MSLVGLLCGTFGLVPVGACRLVPVTVMHILRGAGLGCANPVSVVTMVMKKTHHATELLLDRSQSERRCAVGMTAAQRKSLRRRRDEGLLVNPYRNVYARSEYWETLDPIERHRHVVNAVAILRPEWTFASVSAASKHGLDYSYGLHSPPLVYVADASAVPAGHQYRLLRRVRMPEIATVRMGGVSVTPIDRTLIDCASMLSFVQTMPMFNSALRKGHDLSGLPAMCDDLGIGGYQVGRLLEYATGACENGGEDMVYATIVDLGYIKPRVQFPFHNPDHPDAPLRADFVWIRDDGAIIVAEFDGMGKYVLDDGDRSTIEARVAAERRREGVLRRQGASCVVRLQWEDVLNPESMRRKLDAAGAPRAGFCRMSL